MKTKRIISLILALTLLAGAFSILPVSAEEAASQSVEILKHNVVYKDTIQIAYAVNCPVGTNVTVKYTVDGQTYDAVLYEETYTANDQEYPIYVTHGFYATDFTDVVSATAYIGEEAPASAEYDNYSVAEYFYSMLYKNGYIDYDESDKANNDRKNLYLSLINYGKYAQEVLINNKGGESTLITDYAYFYAANDSGVTINGEESALVLPGSEVTFGGSATGYMVTLDGETVDAAGTYTAEAGQVIAVSAKSADVITVMDYENGASNAYVSSKDGDGNLVTGTWATGEGLTMGTNTSGDNTYLQVRNAKNSGKTGITTVNLGNSIQTGNCYTFQTKVMIAGGTGGYNFARIKFVNNNDGEALNLYLKMTANASGATNKPHLAIATTGTNASVAAGTTLFDLNDKAVTTNDWCTIRIEFYFGGPVAEDAADDVEAAAKAQTYMKLYVDDILAYDGQANWAMGANINRAEIEHVSVGANQNACYDDIYFTRTDKAYVEGNN